MPTKKKLPVLALRVRAVRKALGLGQMGFAERVGIHIASLQLIERGERRTVRTDTLQAIADVDPEGRGTDWLLGRDAK